MIRKAALQASIFAAASMLIHSPLSAQEVVEEEAADEKRWTVSVSGGATVFSGASDQPFGEVSLSHDFGEGHVELAVSQLDSGGDAALAGFVPARTRQIALSGGKSFGAVSVDTYISFGERAFDSLEFARRDGRSVTIDSDGSSFGIGGSVIYDLPVGESGFLSPAISLDYAEADVARVANIPGTGLFSIAEQEDGFTTTASLTYQHLFGADYAHNLGASAAFVHSTNNAVYSPGNSPQALINLFALRDTPGIEDSWAEVGAIGSFGLSDSLRLNLVGIRTIGFDGPEATSVSAGLAISF